MQSTQACTRQARERAHTETPAVKVTSQRETIRWSHLHVQNSENNQGTNERARAGTPLKRWHFSQEPREITRIVARNELLAGQLRAASNSAVCSSLPAPSRAVSTWNCRARHRTNNVHSGQIIDPHVIT